MILTLRGWDCPRGFAFRFEALRCIVGIFFQHFLRHSCIGPSTILVGPGVGGLDIRVGDFLGKARRITVCRVSPSPLSGVLWHQLIRSACIS